MDWRKNLFPLLGISFSMGIIICGVLFLTGKLAHIDGYSFGSGLYDYGFASFGADFYTYVSNNAYLAAQHAQGAARYASQIAHILKNFCGIVLIGFGSLGACNFGTKIVLPATVDKKAVESIETEITGENPFLPSEEKEN